MDEEVRYWRGRYNETATQFTEDWQVGRWQSPYLHAMVYRCLYEILTVYQGRPLNVLDVCCGTGALLQWMSEHGFMPVGLDNSEGVLKRLKDTPGRQSLSVLQADAGQLPFVNESYNIVVSIGMLQCFDDIEGYLAELVRTTTKLDSHVILLFSPDSWLVRLRVKGQLRMGNADMHHYRLHSPEKVINSLKSLGFSQIHARSVYYIYYMPLLRPILRFMNRHLGCSRFLRPFATSTILVATR